MTRLLVKMLVSTLLMAAAGGCGSADDFARVGVSGKVTLGGEPLPKGTIAFVPLEAGPAVQGTIVEGSYTIGPSEGPGPGKYRVEIYSVQPTGKQVPDRGLSNELVAEMRNAVPRRYNIDSGLKAEIKSAGDQEFDYQLDKTEDTRTTSRIPGQGRGRR